MAFGSALFLKWFDPHLLLFLKGISGHITIIIIICYGQYKNLDFTIFSSNQILYQISLLLLPSLIANEIVLPALVPVPQV